MLDNINGPSRVLRGKVPNLVQIQAPDLSYEAPQNLQSKGTLTLDDLGHVVNNTPKNPRLVSGETPFASDVAADLTGRYDTVVYGANNENAYAQQQSGLSQAINGTLKGATLVATTMAGGFGMAYGSVKAALPGGKFSDIWKNPVMENLEKLNEAVDQKYLPNYYSDIEKNAKWYSSDNLISWNFVFDKLVKNAGYAVGAMYSGNIMNGLLKAGGSILGGVAAEGALAAERAAMVAESAVAAKTFKTFTPVLRNLSRAFSAGKNLEAEAALQAGLNSIADVEKVSAELGSIARTTNKFAKIGDEVRRTAIAAYSSAGEASFEALQTTNQHRESLIQQYKDTHFGADPTGDDLEAIEENVRSLGAASFVGNMALLGVTEYFQLNKLLGSSYSAEKQAANSLMGEINQTVVKGGKVVAKVPTTKFGKILDRTIGVGKYVFDPKEAAQENLQYALQIGTQHYFNKAYQGKEAQTLVGTALAIKDSAKYGLVGENSRGEGVGSLNSKEGLESTLLGGITGGGMQAIANFGQAAKKAANTDNFLKSLNNAPTFKKAFVDRMGSVNRGVKLQEEEQAAIVAGDILEAKDRKADQMHNYLSTRIKYGRYDMIKEDIKDLRRIASTEKGISDLKEEGVANINDTIETFNKRLSTFEQIAKDTNEIYKSLDLRYSGMVNKKGEYIYTPETIDKLAYAASKINNYDQRIPGVNQALTLNNIPTFDLLGKIMDGKATPTEAKKEGYDAIDKLDIAPEEKSNLKLQLDDVIEMSLRRKLYINEYEDIRKNPDKWTSKDESTSAKDITDEEKEDTEPIAPPVAAQQTQATPVATPPAPAEGGEASTTAATEVVEPIVTPERKIATFTNKRGEEESFEQGRQYVNKGYNENDPLHKFKVVDVNEDGTIDVELADGSVVSFNPELFSGAERLRDGKDVIVENAQQIKDIQDEFEEKSDFSTGFETDEYVGDKEPALPSADKLFFRTTTASSRMYPNGLPINVTRYNEFTNNVDSFPNRDKIRFVYVTPNQQNELGLSRLAELSYMKDNSFVTSPEWIESITGVEKGLVMAVFVEQEGGKLFLIDKDGKRIKNQDGSDAVLGNPNNNFDIKQTIFSTTPTTEGTGRSSEDKETVDHYRQLWKDKRADLLKAKYQPGEPIESYEFDLSKGFAVREEGNVQHNPISKVFGKIKQSVISGVQGLIEVSTLGYIVHKNGMSYKFAVGRPVLKYGDKLEYLQNDKVTPNQAVTIVEVLKKLHDVFADTSMSTDQKKKENAKLLNYIKAVLFWSSKKVTHNSFYINYATGEINIAGKNFDFSDVEGQKKEIIEALSNVYTNTSNELLTKYFNEPFYEQFWDGKELKERKWKNYQTYLLSDVMPDNKTKRNTAPPLTVNITAPTESVPFVYEQKYAFPTNLQLANPQVTKYDLTGKTPNTMNVYGIDFEFTYGPEGVQFTQNAEMIAAVEGKIERAIAGDPELANEDPEKLLGQMLRAVSDEIKNKLGVVNPVDVAPAKFDTSGVTPNTIELQGIKFTFTHDGKKATLDDSEEFMQGAFLDGLNKLIDSNPAYASIDPTVLASSLLTAAQQEADKVVANQITNDVKATVTPTQAPAPSTKLKREDLPEQQSNTRTPATQALLDYFAEVEGIDKFTEPLDKGTYVKWLQEAGPLGYAVSEKLNAPQVAFDLITEDAKQKASNEKNAQAPVVGQLESLTEVLDNYGLTDEFKFITPILLQNDVKVSFDAAHRGGKLPGVASIDSEVVDGKYQMILTINKAAFDKKGKAEQKYVIAHEFTHGLIKIRLNEKGDIKGTELYNGLNDIYQSVLDYYHKGVSGIDKNAAKVINDNFSKPQITYLRQKLDYIGASIEEMAALGLTDPDMIKFLKLMPGTTPAYAKKNLFTQLVDLISKIVGLPNSKFNDLLTFMSEQLEEATGAPNTGVGVAQDFLNQQITPKQRRRRDGYPVFPELSAEQKYYLTEDFKAAFYLSLFKDNASLFNFDRTSANAIFKNIVDAYKAKGAQYTDEQYMEIIDATKRQLNSLYISFDSDEIVTINDEGTSDKLYAPEAFSVNLKKSTPYAVKILNSSLLRTDGKQSEDPTMLPKVKVNEAYDTVELIPENEVYSVLVNRLVNIKSVDDFVNKLYNIALSNPDYVQLFVKLGGNMVTGKVDFDNFENPDFRLFISAMQTYTKAKPEMFIQYLKEDSTFRGAADLSTGAKQVEKRWINNMILASKQESSIVKYNRDEKQYEVNADSLPEDSIEFLNKIGITFTPAIYDKLNNLQKKEFEKAVIKIKADITSGKKKGVVSLKRGKFKTLGNGISRLADLFTAVEMPNQNNSIYNAEGKRINTLTESNAPSLFEYQFNSIMNLSEIEEKMPQLLDVFSTSSDILKRGGLFFNEDGERIVDEDGNITELKVQVISGELDTDENEGSGISGMNEAESFITQINQNIKGSYYILIPADSSTEWMMNLGNRISYKQFAEGRGIDEAVDMMRKHLDADIELALDAKNREKLSRVKGKGTELRFFKDILPEDLNEEITSLIKERVSGKLKEKKFRTELNKVLTDNNDKITESITNYLEDSAKNTADKLKALKLVTVSPKSKEGNVLYTFKKLDAVFQDDIKSINNVDVNNMTEEDLNIISRFLTTNYILNNIEFHKILFGDPYQFGVKSKNGKVILEETKRIKMFLSPRKFAIDFPQLNSWLNEYNNAIELENGDYIDLDENDYGYHESKSYINTAVIKDVIVEGGLYPGIDTNEADGFSYASPGFYREVKTKNGQWGDQADDFHNWQMAYARKQLAAKGVYKGYDNKPALKKYDEELTSKPSPKFVTDVMKPIVAGDKFNKTNIDLIGHKMSQMPIYYQAVEGKALEDVFIKMFNENLDYIVMESGTKFGTEEMYELYKDGKINDEPMNNLIQVPFKAYGIQVETGYKDKKGQTLGSQPTKIATIDLFSGGQAIGATPERQEAIKDAVERHDNALKRLYAEGADSLLNDLGITYEDGEFTLANKEKVAEVLREQLIDDGASSNLIASLEINPETGDFNTPLESSPNYMQIVRLLYSIIHKRIISPKVNGMSAVQTPVTGWEDLSKGRRVVEINGKKVLTDDTLKFYEDKDENGVNLRYCEVFVTLTPQARDLFSDTKRFPDEASIVEYLDKASPDALMAIGFRIPTDGLHAMDRVKIKGILPNFMGTTVVVPSEITTKVGSDFDIDKLNMYIKALYKDALGNIKVIEYKGSEEATKEFYGEVFDQVTEKEQRSLSKKFDEVDLEDADAQQKLITRQEELNDKIINKQAVVDKMYRQAIENEYYSAIDGLLSLPENFERLIKPTSADTLEGIANDMDTLNGYNESNIKNRLLDRQYMSFLRYAFQKGKSWIGISATATTGHSLAQKAGLFVDHIFKLSLPHNQTADGKVDLSQRFFKDTTKYISDILSEFTNAFADAGSNPFIFKLIYSNAVVSPAMFLVRAGVDIKQAMFFLNQPIVKDFVTTAEADGKYILTEMTADESTLLDSIRAKYAASKEAVERTTEIDVKSLNKNIGVENLTEDQKAEQLLILQEFFSVAKAANGLFIITEATNYDTFKSSNADDFRRKQMKTLTQYKFADDSFRISSAKDLLDKTHLRSLVNALTKANKGLGKILRFNTPSYRAAINKVIDTYAINDFISPTNFSKIANKLSGSLLDYIIQTNGNFDPVKLVQGENSVINKFQKAVKSHPDMKILQDLEVIPGKTINSPSTIALKVSPDGAADIDRYTEAFRELRNNPETNDLYKDLVKLAILQGTYKTAVSFKEVVPQEDLSEEITKSINTPGVEDTLQDFYKNCRFQRTNFNDPNVAPRINPPMKYRPEADIPLPSGNVIEAYSFPSAITFNGADKESSRDLIGLGLKSKGSKYDFVTITRGTYTKEGELVDFESGYTVQPSDLAVQLQKDENMYNKVYGYQKVKYPNGAPVRIKMSESSPEQYVFKLVNLYGDGRYLTQYQNTLQKSELNNGTVKVAKEYSDDSIIKALDKQGKLVGYSETAVQPVQEPRVVNSLKELAELNKGREVKLTYAKYNRPFTATVTGEVEEVAGPTISTNSAGEQTIISPAVYNMQFKTNTGKLVTANLFEVEGLIGSIAETPAAQPTQAPTIEVVDRYTDADVKANPNKIYVFGDNTKRVGTGGQAQIRNNPNAMGIATKLAPSMEESAFMTDLDLASNKAVIDSDISKIKATGKTVVFPKDGLGTGLAKLQEKAPQTYAYLKQRLLQEFGFNNNNAPVVEAAPAVEEKPANIEILEKLEMAKNKLETFELSTDGVFYNYFKSGARIKPGSFDKLVDRNKRSASTNGAYTSTQGAYAYDSLARQAFEAANMEVEDDFAVEALEEFLSNYPDTWKTPYDNIINEINELENQLNGVQATVKVGKDQITIDPNGNMFYADNTIVKDEVVRNQANIQKELKDGTLRVATSGGFQFFVLSNNKILLSAKNNLGKEYIADSEMTQRILDKAIIYKKTC